MVGTRHYPEQQEGTIKRQLVDQSPSRVLPAGESIDPFLAYLPPSSSWSFPLKSIAPPVENICFLERLELLKQLSLPKKFQEFKKISFVCFPQIWTDCMSLLILSQNYCNNLPHLQTVSGCILNDIKIFPSKVMNKFRRYICSFPHKSRELKKISLKLLFDKTLEAWIRELGYHWLNCLNVFCKTSNVILFC